MKIIILLLIVLCIPGCEEEVADFSVSEATIYNIPAEIPVHRTPIIDMIDGKEVFKRDNNGDFVYDTPEIKAPAYQIYLAASNSTNDWVAYPAEGISLLSAGKLEENGTYTITLQLNKPIVNLKTIAKDTPNPAWMEKKDPYENSGPWKGTANNFAVFISPEIINTDDAENLIWVKGSQKALNKTSANIDWNNLIDFRYQIDNKTALNKAMDFKAKSISLYEHIILRDPNTKFSD